MNQDKENWRIVSDHYPVLSKTFSESFLRKVTRLGVRTSELMRRMIRKITVAQGVQESNFARNISLKRPSRCFCNTRLHEIHFQWKLCKAVFFENWNSGVLCCGRRAARSVPVGGASQERQGGLSLWETA